MAHVLAETPVAGVLGGLALVITALGGMITAIIAARRQQAPMPGPLMAPNAVEVWVETLRQLDACGEERDDAIKERDQARREVERWRIVAEECQTERLELLRHKTDHE